MRNMYDYLHDQFQTFLDNVIEKNISIDEKKELIKSHLLTYQQDYQYMLLSFFEDEELTNDNYFYITYTYKDLPINLNNNNEFVVSMLYDKTNKMHFELVVFNEKISGNEYKEIFSQDIDFFN